MPIRTVETAPGYRVIDYRCDVCGGPASYGFGGSVREALRTGDASKAGRWTCGPRGCVGAPESDENAA